ncbi:MAG: hypothetical protein AABY22_19580 [Nanoarchaeota archaeon]
MSFKTGSRNTTITTLVGYSLHLGLSEDKLKAEVVDQIDKDPFIKEEISRLWKYCKTNNYGDYWGTKDAKVKYKF